MIEIFKFPLPPTMNEIINLARCGVRANKYCASASSKRKWTNKIRQIALSQKPYKFQGKVWVEFYWTVNNWGRDPDNIYGASKFIFDGLVAGKIIKNDNLGIVQSPVIHYYFRGKDGVFVVISANPISPDQREQFFKERCLNLS